MFFVSNINGELLPYQIPAQLPALELSAADNSVEEPATTAVESTPALETNVPSEPQQSESISQSITTVASQEDAAIFDGHAIAGGQTLLGVSGQSIGLAGASVAYRMSEGEQISVLVEDVEKKPLAVEQIIPVAAVEAVDAEALENRYNMSPGRQRSSNGYPQVADLVSKRQPALTLRHIMSAPVIILQDSEPLERARYLFREKRIRHIPIVSQGGKMIGILSDRDFIAPSQGVVIDTVKLEQKMVRDLMTTNILTARPETEIRTAAHVMVENRIGALPIIDDGGKLIGVVTRSDILRAVVKHAPLELWT